MLKGPIRPTSRFSSRNARRVINRRIPQALDPIVPPDMLDLVDEVIE
jgi:hypothetical protein